VVHESHGIGRYQGLVHMDLGEGDTEFLHLEYADGAKLYVPVAQLHLISRYSGASADEAPLHKLGSGQWEKAKRKAAEQVRDTAAELLNLYAQRAAREGHAVRFKQHDLEAFADGFGFEETPDQQAAINAVIQDMISRASRWTAWSAATSASARPRSRCAPPSSRCRRQAGGHAGPTTLLAEQHYQTFSDRFAKWPVKIAELSRFRRAKDRRRRSRAGQGTDRHRDRHPQAAAEGREVQAPGPLIIDEEHRFGVRQKEALKALRAEVDVLTLTATPIPRTLGMSLEGLRDFSVIATAPQKRLAIKTFVHPEVQRPDPRSRAARVQARRPGLLPAQRGRHHREHVRSARRAAARGAHRGRPRPDAGARAGARDARLRGPAKHNLLLCSTIIETGIDNPHANTIVINRADKFGLAQLHQLRGRVGRSHHQAYAYLLVPGRQGRPSRPRSAWRPSRAMEELGSGFYLAMHDLEIRGAGEVLGESQSGEIQEVGFSLYTDMLNAAVRALKAGEKVPDLTQPLPITSEINLHVPALLTDDYCPDVHERLTLYKRLANCESWRAEAIDRACRRIRPIAQPPRPCRLGRANGDAQQPHVDRTPCPLGKR
jgi:transcription-repair coupling factor (superfamily II helicase)